MAGRIKNKGRFYMLLPRALDPVEAGRDTPLPLEPTKTSGFEDPPPDDCCRWNQRPRLLPRQQSGPVHRGFR